MRGIIYKWVMRITKALGEWVFLVISWWIASGYFFLFPGRVASSLRFYRALLPDKNVVYHLWCVWRQYHNFTHVYLDRYKLYDRNDLSYTSEGMEHLERAIREKTGGIILMSHVGNWEIAAHLLRRTGLRLMLYMGIKNKEQIERVQKQSLEETGIRIIAVEQEGGSPFDLIEGIDFIRGGGLVSLAGDRLWRNDQRAIAVRFLGRRAVLPETPHLFALLSGAPLFTFFAFRTGKRSYHFSITPPRYVRAAARSGRTGAISRSAQEYADLLAETARAHPFEWYHFEPFIEPGAAEYAVSREKT